MYGQEMKATVVEGLDELPFDVHLTLCLRGDLGECTKGQIDGVLVIASRAVINDCDDDGLVVGSISDLDLLAADGRLVTGVTVPVLVNSSNQVTVGVDLTAGTGNTVLVEESGDSTSDETTARGSRRSGGGGRRVRRRWGSLGGSSGLRRRRGRGRG